MTTINFGIRLTADGDAFVGNVRVAKAEFDKLTGGIEQGAKRASDATERLSRTVGTAAKVGIGAVVVSEAMQYAKALADTADAATNVRSRLALVSGTAANTAQVYGELFRIAQASRIGFQGLAGTYAQIARSADESGISQDRMLKVTQALSQAITISGGSAASAQAAMVQLSQGLASGTLRGEELNSILEQTPRVAQAIAQGLGVGIGQLRKMGEEGKLTAEAVVEALERSAPTIAAEFQRMTPTIGQALTTLGNSGLNLVGTLDRLAGTSGRFAGILSGVADAIDSIAGAIDRAEPGLKILAALFAGGPGAIFDVASGRVTETPAETVDRLAKMEAALTRPEAGRTAYDRANRDRQLPGVQAELEQARARLLADGTTDVRDARATAGFATAERGRKAVAAFLDDKTVQSKAQRRISEINELSTKYVAAYAKATTDAERSSLLEGVQQGIANIEDRFKDKKPPSTKAAENDRRQALATQLADERAAIEAGERLKIQTIESLGRQGLRTEQEVVAERLKVQTDSIDRQIALAQQARAAAGADLSERERANATINGLMRERLAVEQQATNELAELAIRRAAAVDAETQAFRKARYDDIASLRESVRSMTDENAARLQSIVTGRDEAEMLRELRIARLESELAVDERPDPEKVERVRLLREELRLLRERRELAQVQTAGADQRAAAGKLAEEMRARETDFTRSLTDALYRGFENGKGFAENFRDTLKSTIGTLVLRPLIEPIVRPVGNLVASGMENLLKGLFGGTASGYGYQGAAGAETIDSMMGNFAGFPGRALGGDVAPFGTYLVGEEGPELLRMGKQGGSITPNPATLVRMGGSSGAPVIHQHFDFSNSMGVAEMVQQAASIGARMGSQQALGTIESANRRNDPTYTS